METRKLLCIPAVVLVLALAHITPASADEDRWSTNGPHGGTVMSIGIHPFDNELMYIGTTGSGMFRTTNGGADWSIIEHDTLWQTAIFGVKFHPYGPDTIFANTDRGAFKSTDAGQTWFRMPLLYPENPYQALEVNVADPPVIFAGTWGDAWRSIDGGQTWMVIDLGIDTDVVTAIKADPLNPDIIYLANNSDVPDRSIFKSTDCGETWRNIHNDIPPTEDTFGRAIDISPFDPRIVYFARSNRSEEEGQCLFKSTDGGEYWVDISPPGLAPKRVVDVTASPLDINTVFVCTDSDGIFRSTDGGSNWQQIYEGLVTAETKSVVIDPVTGFLYLGLAYDGIYRSIDNGDTWERISYNVTGAHCSDIAINRRNPDSLYVATYGSRFSMSGDGGESWNPVDFDSSYPLPVAQHVEIDPYDPSYVYLSRRYPDPSTGRSGLYRSADGGATWEFFTAGLPYDTQFYDLAVVIPSPGIRRLFMESSAGLFSSDDLGENWTICQGGLPPDIYCAAIKVSPLASELIFVSEKNGPVYKSLDAGDSWEALSGLPPGGYVEEIACDPVDPDIIYIIVSNERGLYKSTDGGQSWHNINNNLPRGPYGLWLSGIAISPYNHDIFVYSLWCGMSRSSDGGQSWEPFNEGLLIRAGLAHTLFDPGDPRRIFMAQVFNSVWEITMTGGGGDCVYTPGDCDHNGTALELPDVIAMIGLYRGSVEPNYTCDCPPHGDNFAAEADPNGNCITLELADVVTEIGAYRGTAEAAGCPDCPGSLRLMPGADSPASSGIPSLSTKVKSKAGSITR